MMMMLLRVVMPATKRCLSLVAFWLMSPLLVAMIATTPITAESLIILGGQAAFPCRWTKRATTRPPTAVSSLYYCYHYHSTVIAMRRRTTASWIASSMTTMNDAQDPRNQKGKTITFIRHGCTYMNEYLGGADGGRSFGSPHFTDIFDPKRRTEKYQDSPLSPSGLRQARAMAQRTHDFVTDCELVVTSPLTRALQTFDIGLRSHFVAAASKNSKKNTPTTTAVPVIALPEAAERLYLISDVGRSVNDLPKLYDYVDFETGFVRQQQQQQHDRDQWWFNPNSSKNRRNPHYHVEWRPVGQGQRYACPGEPLPEFHRRMMRLHAWLDARPERHIAVVCHHGVIQSFLDCDFDNCQYRSVLLENIQPQFVIEQEEIWDER